MLLGFRHVNTLRKYLIKILSLQSDNANLRASEIEQGMITYKLQSIFQELILKQQPLRVPRLK
jgi:hypothetical protein